VKVKALDQPLRVIYSAMRKPTDVVLSYPS
jgi:hypothetical protein